MRSCLITLLLLCLCLTSCHRTTPEQQKILAAADSLLTVRPDSALHLLKEIRNYRRLTSPGRALYALLMTEALDKCDSVIASDSLISIATHYYGRKDPNRAGYAWFYLARCRNNMGDAKGCAEAILKAQDYAAQEKNHKLLGFVYSEKATLYKIQQQTDSMLYYYKQTYYHFQKAKDTRNVVICLLNISTSYFQKKQYQMALKYCNLALKICPENEEMLITTIYRILSMTYCFDGKYVQALRYARLAYSHSDYYDYSKAINMATIFGRLGYPDSAVYYLKKCGDPHSMTPEYYQAWITIAAKQNNYHTVAKYTDKLVFAKDSLYQHSLSESFAGMERKYKFDGLTSENQALTIHNQQIVIILLVLLLAIGTGASTFTLWRRKLKKALIGKEKELAGKEDIILQKEYEKIHLQIEHDKIKAVLKERIETFRLEVLPLFIPVAPNQKVPLKIPPSRLKDALRNLDAYYNGLGSRLKAAYPVNDTEIKVALLVLGGFTSAQIAQLFPSTESNINVTRSNLRKKMQVQEHADLTDSLARF